MKKAILGAVLFLLFVATSVGNAQSTQNDAIAAIQKSHIDANVPEQSKFDSFLRRDLAKYFKEKTGRELEITYEMLRTGPTQVGIAYPKFYVWVLASAEGKVVHEGALRLAAVQKTHFAITDYIPKSDAAAAPKELVKVFPAPVVEKIKLKLKPTVPNES